MKKEECEGPILPFQPPDPGFLEMEVIAGFRVWQLAFMGAMAILILIIVLCCLFRCRIPRTKQEIEADVARKKVTKTFSKHLERLPVDKMELDKVLPEVIVLEHKRMKKGEHEEKKTFFQRIKHFLTPSKGEDDEDEHSSKSSSLSLEDDLLHPDPSKHHHHHHHPRIPQDVLLQLQEADRLLHPPSDGDDDHDAEHHSHEDEEEENGDDKKSNDYAVPSDIPKKGGEDPEMTGSDGNIMMSEDHRKSKMDEDRAARLRKCKSLDERKIRKLSSSGGRGAMSQDVLIDMPTSLVASSPVSCIKSSSKSLGSRKRVDHDYESVEENIATDNETASAGSSSQIRDLDDRHKRERRRLSLLKKSHRVVSSQDTGTGSRDDADGEHEPSIGSHSITCSCASSTADSGSNCDENEDGKSAGSKRHHDHDDDNDVSHVSMEYKTATRVY